MLRQKRQTYYVICAGPCPRVDPDPRWLTRESVVTTLRAKAARFVTVTETHDFADAHGIILDGVTCSIDREEFIVIQLHVFPA
jgi:hypothetical protein